MKVVLSFAVQSFDEDKPPSYAVSDNSQNLVAYVPPPWRVPPPAELMLCFCQFMLGRGIKAFILTDTTVRIIDQIDKI